VINYPYRSRGAHFGRAVIDLKQLARFVAVASNGSFRRAARELGANQPALSWSVQQLEKTLGSRLFDRTARGIKLTAAGELLLPRAQLMLHEAERAQTEIAAAEQGAGEQLVVGSTPPYLIRLVPMVLAKVLALRPALSVRLVQLDSDRVAHLRNGTVDVCVCNFRRDTPLEEFDFEAIVDETYVLAARSAHPLFQRRRAVPSLEDVARYGWVLHERAAGILSGQSPFAAHNLPFPAVRVKVNSEHSLRPMILNSDLLGYVALGLIQRDVDERSVRVIPLRELTLRIRAGLLMRRNVVYTPAMKLFCREVRLACRAARDG